MASQPNDPDLDSLTDSQIRKVLSDAAESHARLIDQIADGVRTLTVPYDPDPAFKRGGEAMKQIVYRWLSEHAARAQQIADEGA